MQRDLLSPLALNVSKFQLNFTKQNFSYHVLKKSECLETASPTDIGHSFQFLCSLIFLKLSFGGFSDLGKTFSSRFETNVD